MIQTLPLYVDLSFKKCFFALLVEINVKNIRPTDKYLYDSLFGSNIRVIFYDLFVTFDTFYCCFSAKIG